MLNLFNLTTKATSGSYELSYGEQLSVTYHNIFDYPLTIQDLIKWKVSDNVSLRINGNIIQKSGYYYQEGKEGIIYKRLLRKRISTKKMILAKNAAKLLKYLPNIKMVAVTGSLAMENATNESDIDLLIITKKDRLWLTRVCAYAVLKISGFKIRKAQDKKETDKLCLNMWLDETALTWPKENRNLYTAHEIAQIKPLVNKNNIHNLYLNKNKWILNYWPNSVKINKINAAVADNPVKVVSLLDNIFYKIQYKYMASKITREVVAKNKALFHPQDWGKVVMGRLSS